MSFIYKVSLMIEAFESTRNRENEFNMRIKKMPAEEKNKTYVFWDTRMRKYKKEKLGTLESPYDENSYKFIGYHIYCLENQLEQSKEKLIKVFSKKVEDRVKAINILQNLFQKGCSIEFIEEKD